MRKYSFLLFLSLLACGSLSAQLVNNGGTITIQNNAKLVVQSDITNTTGTIVNSGIIEVEGDFTNAATVTSNAGSKVVFKGTEDSNFDSGGASFAVVENNKTAGDVILTSDLAVAESVDFSGTSNIVLGANDLTMESAATSNGAPATGHFNTSSTGNVVKIMPAAGNVTFDVGDGTNFTPLLAECMGTFAANTTVTAKVTDGNHPNLLADATDYISRYWTVSNTITNPSIDLTGTYVAADVTGSATDMVGARREGTSWEFINGGQAGSNVTSTTTEATSELTGMNFYGKSDITMYLQGAYNNNGTMSNNYNAVNGLPNVIPTTNPYDATETGVTIPANAVDWVRVELRDAALLTTPLTTKGALLLTNGTLIGGDGNELLLKDATNSSHVAVFHQNHLGLMTQGPASFLTSEPTLNFTDGTTAIFNFGVPVGTTMTDGALALASGDGTGEGTINIFDKSQVWLPTNGSFIFAPADYDSFSAGDFNMDRSVNIFDITQQWLSNNSKFQQIPQ